jgi:hypothetical protein
MTQDQLFQFMQARPFRPFRLKTAGGREFTIVHPEFIAYGGERTALVVLPGNRFEVIDTDLIESIEGTNEAPAASRPQGEDQDQD